MSTNFEYRSKIAAALLGRPGDFPAYFRLYDELFNFGTGGHIIEFGISPPRVPGRQPTDHDMILTAAQLLKTNTNLTPEAAGRALLKQLPPGRSQGEIDFVLNLAVQAMYMVDANIRGSDGSFYATGKSWNQGEAFVDFVARCFPQVSAERQEHIAMVIEERKALKAWKLRDRLNISFKGTDNLANHLLFDPRNRVVYVFHHAAYLKAHLDLWSERPAAKDAGISSALEHGTLSPRLLAETLHSLQSILFCYDDDRSMTMLQQLVKRHSFDHSSCIHEGYKMFQSTADSFPYTYWGERLAVLHGLMNNRPPRTNLGRWVRWRASESNSFLIAMLALAISIVVGILSLGLSGLQVWIAWQAWKFPVDGRA
ncbi:hypothetical protein QBC34DRAFT_494267 [Podospora aff. communis PSN243]|uniref:Uncharacterized protein n=1 Tax=Podospora aff. communis PSN243 TaxID=3040156 RepID=A0AAV9GPD3_9PEZI|nr:hypothetical protein QBC34DRAFT_494267 [Podospora aff. communis PSN243]